MPCVAAADGRVADIVEIDETEVFSAPERGSEFFFRSSTCTRTARRLKGRIIYRQEPRRALSRRAPCRLHHEKPGDDLGVRNPRVTFVVRQLTGMIARRIVGWSKVGDELKKGERFGMIRFGSRTEVYLPLDADGVW